VFQPCWEFGGWAPSAARVATFAYAWLAACERHRASAGLLGARLSDALHSTACFVD
jgi:hypothetical protein